MTLTDSNGNVVAIDDEEFDPNELMLLPVLATDRQQRFKNDSEMKQLKKQ